MNQNLSSFNSEQDQIMTTEQFDEIVEAILCGKYSWACVLILRFANYNPLHYIPYRTYKRLIKDNQQTKKIGSFSANYPSNNRELSTVESH